MERGRGGEESNVIDGTTRNYIAVYLKITIQMEQ